MSEKDYFYKKLNEYYEYRDNLYTLKSNKGQVISIVDFIICLIISVSTIACPIILIVKEKQIGYSLFFIPFIIVLLLLSLSIVKNRKKYIKELNRLKKELQITKEKNSPLYDESKLDLKDYVEAFKMIGFKINVSINSDKTVYVLNNENTVIKLTSKESFFINTIKCEIDGVDFKKIESKDEFLQQLVKDYKLDYMNKNYYQMLDICYRYVYKSIGVN